MGLDIPFYMEEDQDKSMWRIIKEQSLTLANLQPYIIFTESPLFNQETLCSGSLETFGNDNYDIKGVLISENDNLTPITKLLLKFPKFDESVINKVELPDDKTGWTAAAYYAILREFNKIWREDIQIDVSRTESSGKFVHVLKVSSSNSEKIRLLKKELEKMNQKISIELGLPIKTSTELTKGHKSEFYQELRESESSDKLFFTGKKMQMLPNLQALQNYVSGEFSWLKEANFKLDYVRFDQIET